MQYPVNKKSGPETVINSGPDFVFTGLVSRFVLLYDIRLDTTTCIYLDAVLSRPQAYPFGVRATLRGGPGAGCRTATSASYFAASIGKACQCFTQFVRMTLIEVNLIFSTV